MLEVTDGAVEVIRTMADNEDAASPEAGLRIATAETSADGVDLALDFVAGPAEGDATVEQDGVRVYLSADAAELLDDKTLDAHEHGDHVHFSIEEQAAA
jgi:Fe-S cluster assembly iron-binding protein IscA